MKKLLQYSVLILIYIVVSAKSCDNVDRYNSARELRKVNVTKDSICSIFSSEQLHPATLRAFEETAILNSTDFSDYTRIMLDSSSAPEFRNHAGQLIRNLFISDKSVIRFMSDAGQKKNAITIDELISSKSLPFIDLIRLKPDSVWILNELHPESDSVFAGRIGFSYPKSLISPADEMHCSDGTIDFYAAKRKKKFGSETLNVWTVLLGDIHVQEERAN